MLRDRLAAALKESMLKKDAPRTSALRLMLAAQKERDVEARAAGQAHADDATLIGAFGKMLKQREDSAAQYDAAGRADLAAKERAETLIIKEFLPQPLSEADAEAMIRAAVADSGAAGIKDMGKAMALLKERAAGRLDMAKAGPRLKAILSGGA